MMLDTFELYEELAEAMGPEAAPVLAAAMGRLYREIASTVNPTPIPRRSRRSVLRRPDRSGTGPEHRGG